MKLDRLRIFAALAALTAAPPGAFAHGGHVDGAAAAAVTGLLHPLTGLDHLLAMLAVGIWAAQTGGAAVWRLPLAFLGSMVVGGGLGLAHMPVLFVEFAIAASVLALGALIVASARPSDVASVATVSAFALFHGYAHVAEMTPGTSAALYGSGFLVTTVMLHLAGIGLVFLSRGSRATSLVRAGGALIIACGGLLLFLRL